ncbi:MAG: monofunctional biosynthetic peptidoglycan transglycosylase [Candidatus Eisenbacteria bacterium]
MNIPARRRSPGLSGWIGRGVTLVAGLALALLCVAWVQVAGIDVRSLATHVPERTALMHQREREARTTGRKYVERRNWVAYERISPSLRRAVLVAEDDAFFSHDGLDWNEIKASAQKNWHLGRFARGGSTITQQLAKNLWLGTERTPTRKFKELLLALRLERALSKKRIFELYLNSIEWGDGIYGVDAAARRWYATSASGLTARQSVRLAAVIINPRRYSPTSPERRIARRVRMIASRLRRRGALSEADYRAVLDLPEISQGPLALDSLAVVPAEPPPLVLPEPDTAATEPEAVAPQAP